MTVVCVERESCMGSNLLGGARQVLMVILINIPTISFGLALGWVSLASGEGANGGEAGLVAAAGGTFLAGLLGVPLSAKALMYGRKTALAGTSLAMAICWSLKLVGGRWWVIAARVMAGLGGAGAWCVSPLLAREMCSDRYRGAAVSTLVLAHNLGLLIMYAASDARIQHDTILWCCLALSLAHCVVVMFIPESPSYLAAAGKPEEAQASLAWLRGVKADNAALRLEVESLPPPDPAISAPVALVKDLFSSSGRSGRRRAFLVCVVSVAGQEACGVLALLQFAERLFLLARGEETLTSVTSAGSVTSSLELSSPARHALWLGVVQFVASAFALYLVERVGRKPLLVTTSFLVSLFMGACGVYILCSHVSPAAPAALTPASPASPAAPAAASPVWGAQWVPGALLAAALAADSAGLQPVPYAMLTEMFDYQYRSCVHMLVMTASCLGNALEIAVFPAVVALAGGVSAALLLSAALTLLYAFFALYYVPETRGKTVEQIYAELVPARSLDGAVMKCGELAIDVAMCAKTKSEESQVTSM